MSKITSFNINLSEGINIGNFESVKWNYGITVEVEEGDNYDEIKKEYINEVKKVINNLVKYTKSVNELKPIVKNKTTINKNKNYERKY